ncbi:MAG: helix-turn-helix transcriptional regulator, partial [Candidatus Izimaplasma sp.]|nr:helix-turn-helix transcriptional regulator [Candidatus Izimaplasma bacterium]
MNEKLKIEKRNLKVLGVIVRVNRVRLGYSLRDLAKLINVSHTSISNFEKGIITPHKDVIR